MFFKIYINSLKTAFKNLFSATFPAILLIFLPTLSLVFEYLYRFFSQEYSYFTVLSIKILYYLVIFSPLSYGIYLYFSELSKGVRHKIWEAFGFFTSPRLIFRCIFHKTLGVLIYVLALLPSISVLFFSAVAFRIALNTESAEMLILGFCTLVLAVSLIILGFTFLSRFSLASYIFITNPDLSVISSFRRSYAFTKGKGVYLFKLRTICFIVCALGIFAFPLFFSARQISLFTVYNKICRSTRFSLTN